MTKMEIIALTNLQCENNVEGYKYTTREELVKVAYTLPNFSKAWILDEVKYPALDSDNLKFMEEFIAKYGWMNSRATAEDLKWKLS